MKQLRSRLAAIAEGAASGFLAAVAYPWTRRATLLDTVGAACIVVGAAGFSTRLAWVVAGLWLTLRAGGIERRSS